MTIYTICTTQQKETWKLNSVNFASHLHVSPFFHHILSTDSHFFFCTIPRCRSHNSNGLIFCLFKCTIYWDFCSYCGCTREHLNLFYLPEVLCPDQHLPSIFLSCANAARSAPALTVCAFRLSAAFPVSTEKWSPAAPVFLRRPVFTLVKVTVSPVWTLTSLRAYATFSLSVHLLVDLTLVLCLAFVNKTALYTQSSCLFGRGFLYTHAQ